MMDFPDAWKFMRLTKTEEHDPKCSWRQSEGGMLCDCHIIWDEYHRRRSLEEFTDKYLKPHAAQIEREIRALYECPSCRSTSRAIRLSLDPAYHNGKDICLDGWHFNKESRAPQIKMKPSNVIDYNSPTANMYGCEPCPQCDSKYRCVFQANPDQIDCDNCGFKEKRAKLV
jgi:hypothetical protein